MALIKDQLETLNSTKTTFKRCFKFKDSDVAEAEVNVNILTVYSQLTRKTKTGKILNAKSLVQFHPTILKSLETTNVVPWNWESIMAIKHGKSKAYFTTIDRTLAGMIFSKDPADVQWSRTIEGVVDDMNRWDTSISRGRQTQNTIRRNSQQKRLQNCLYRSWKTKTEIEISQQQYDC